jgi:hypothetical protein
MHSFFNKSLAISITLLCFANTSFASVHSDTCNTNSTYDYGDAIGYDEACHDTNNWQQLGTAVKDSNAVKLEGDHSTNQAGQSATNDGWTKETTQKSEDDGDNGVSWRVAGSSDAFGNGDLTAGTSYEFQFVVTRSDEGNHDFDQLKAWVDWSGGDTNFSSSEIIIDERWYKNEDITDTVNGNSGNGNTDLPTDNNSDTSRTYTSSPIAIPDYAVMNDVWLRARIICENSLSTHDRDNNIFLPTGWYHQGETEDYKLTITQVPEPTTLFVFGSALIGLVINRKKT